ncbi:MAG: late competence development ComFB family protein [Symploca sp. SIO3C6]|nr:late competence development ComFB family protein [Symploca sp. SIO3C6]
MELLVIEEVKHQLDNYPQQLANYINPVEVATYALNRLSPLYASSEEGWPHKTKPSGLLKAYA